MLQSLTVSQSQPKAKPQTNAQRAAAILADGWHDSYSLAIVRSGSALRVYAVAGAATNNITRLVAYALGVETRLVDDSMLAGTPIYPLIEALAALLPASALTITISDAPEVKRIAA